jgi:hypothetical protein
MPSLVGFRWLPLVLAVATACGALYPEVVTPLRKVPYGTTLEPAPPDELVYIRFHRAVIPERTRDGRAWGASPPDAFGRLTVDGKTVVESALQKNTLRPKWSDKSGANYLISKRAKVSVELWDSDALADQLICNERVSDLTDQVSLGELQVVCSSGARVWLKVEPAHAKLGLGLRYEVRDTAVLVTAVARYSPAARAGLKAGDQVVKIQGKDVGSLAEGQAQSLINANGRSGLKLLVRRPGGKPKDLELKEGPIYLLSGADVIFAKNE